jgi:hypothetical protein
MGSFFGRITNQLQDVFDSAVRHRPPSLPEPPSSPRFAFPPTPDFHSDTPAPGFPSIRSDLPGLMARIPFPLGLINPRSPVASDGSNAERRLAAFVDTQGQPLWNSELERAALLSALRQDPSMTVDKWQRGQDMAQLSRAAYVGGPAPSGYRRITAAEAGLDARQLEDPETGLRAAVFLNERTGTYTLAFSGTNEKTDWKHGNSQAFDPNAKQYSQAIELAQALKSVLGSKFTDITGQSLGGGLAAAASSLTRVRATTFNAAGLNPDTIAVHGGSTDVARMRGLITNYRVEGDPLTEAQEGSNIDPVTAWAVSRSGNGFFGRVVGSFAQQMSGLPAPVQHSYISGAMAQQLPDAAGTQVTLFAIGRDGHRLSRREQMSSGNWPYLHGFDAIDRGMLVRPHAPQAVVVNESRVAIDRLSRLRSVAV